MSETLTFLEMLSVIAGSAVVTFFVSRSHERLWLRSQKAEDLYRMSERTFVDTVAFFRARYDQAQMKVFPCAGNELAPINGDIAELNILVGLYFPVLTPQLATATNAVAAAFDMFRLAQASDETNRERALDNLDMAVGNVRTSFDQFKSAVLSAGRPQWGLVKTARRRPVKNPRLRSQAVPAGFA